MELGLVGFLRSGRMDWRELAQRAEDAGFESVFLTEHSHWPADRAPVDRQDPGYAAIPDPFVALGAMAAVTTRLRLGTAVCIVPQHDPINLAKTVTTLDMISGGRFLFGVGAGWIDGELRDHGVEPRTRFTLTWERIALMRRLWTGEVIEYAGRLVRQAAIQQPLVPVQRPGPPVLAGVGRRRLEDVVEHADGWFPHASEFHPNDAAELEQLAMAAGLPIPSISLFNAPPDPHRLVEYRDLGVARCLISLNGADVHDWRGDLKRYASLLRSVAQG